ncbi:MAG: inorganic diphosphatase [bacterium]
MNRTNGNNRGKFPLTYSEALNEVYMIVGMSRGEKFDFKYRRNGNLIHLCPPAPMPEDYGYIPQTSTKDNETLDVVLFCEETTTQGMVVESRVVGGIEFQDERVIDLKLLAVAIDDPEYGTFRSYRDLPKSRVEAVKEFFRSGADQETIRPVHPYEASWITMESITRYHRSNSDPPA